MIHVKESKEYYINSRALTFGENDLENPNRVAVSLVSGTVIMVYVKGTIDYAIDGNFERWTLKGYSTKLAANTSYYIYARLSRTSQEALIIFSSNLYAFDGSINGDDTSTPSTAYWYVRIGYLTETDGISLRQLTYDSGTLGTNKTANEANDLLSKAFVFHFDDQTNPDKLTSIQALAGLWTDSFLSAKGANPNGGGSSEGGATTLGGLSNVAADADKTFDVAKMLVLEADSNLWTLKNLSELVGGLDEAELAEYLTNNNYAKKGDIPTVPTKVSAFDNDANYATTSDLDSRIDALVNGAPQAYDTLKEIADVLANNINSIDDILTALGTKVSQTDFDAIVANLQGGIDGLWARNSYDELYVGHLMADTLSAETLLGKVSWEYITGKPTTLGGYGITDAYTITQIDSIVNGLSGNISTLQGYFTDGVANSALKLSDNGSYTAWGQTFFANGKPKSVSGALTDVTDIASSGTIITNKIVIGNGTIEWDDTNKGFKVTGLYSTTYLSAMGANTNGGSSSGGGLITSLYRYADLGKTFSDTNNDTFNAYTINKINTDLGSRISVLEGKATNVSFTQSLTSGTQIGSISIDGVSKNIYAPTIPTKLSQFTNDLGLGTFAYKSSLAFADLTNKPTTISGYGITDAITTANIGSQSVANANQLKYTSLTSGEDMNTYYGDTYNGKLLYKGSSIDVANFPFSSGGVLLIKTASGSYTTQLAFSAAAQMAIRRVYNTSQTNWRTILHSENYDDYTYSKSTIDTKLGGYLPLSGGTISGVLRTNECISFNRNNTELGYVGFATNSNNNIYLYSANDLQINSAGKLIISPSGGNVGIGTTSPSYKLHVNGTLNATTLYQNGVTMDSIIDGYVTALQGGIDGLWNRNEYDELFTEHLMSDTIAANAIYTDRLSEIYFNGSNVGIGTSSATYKLHVSGTMCASGAVTLLSTLNVTGQTTLSSVVEMGNAVRMVNSKYIYGRTSANVLHNILGVNESDALLVNYGATSQNSKLFTYGSEFRFTTYSDGASVSGATLFYNGKLGVGTSAPEYTADIRGTLRTTLQAIIESSLEVTSKITLSGTTASTANIAFSRSSYNYITFPTDGSLCLSTATSTSGIVLRVTSTAIEPMTTATKSVGTSSKRWGAIYGVDGDFSGTLHATTGIWSDGYVSAKGQNTSSDMRLKNVLNEVVLGVKDIANAPSVRFSWKNGGGVDVGSSAQYWQKLLPDAVKERDGHLEMQYANIALLSAIAIAKRMETHEERIARLEKENSELRLKIERLQINN